MRRNRQRLNDILGAMDMKILLAAAIALLTSLLVLQVHTKLVRPHWEYKIASLGDSDLCELEYKALSKGDADEIQAAADSHREQHSPTNDTQKIVNDVMQEMHDRATERITVKIVTSCLNRLGNDGWELVSLDPTGKCLFKRLKSSLRH